MKKIVVLGNGINWLDICYENVKEDVIFINKKIPFYSNNRLINFLIRIYFSIRNKEKNVILLPFRSIWYKFSVFGKEIKNDDEVCVIIYDHNRVATDEKFLKWLRKKYSKITISYVFTNIVDKSGAKQYKFVDRLNNLYDNVFAFDENDAQKYGFKYNYLIYEPKLTNKTTAEYDVFFVGNAKERLDKLHEAYFKCKELGLKTCFYINQVPEELIIPNTEIIYNKRISYTDSLELLKKSKCMIDFLQDGSKGIVLRICEAILWDKVIITDNDALAKESFYNPEAMLIIKDVSEINKEFVNKKVIYSDKDKKNFKLSRLIEQI